MKKIITLSLVGMLLLIAYGTAVYGEPDDPTGTNRPPNAPIIVEQINDWEKQCYTHKFYSIDPDGDQVYYDISWEKINKPKTVTSSPDDPLTPWLGPYESGKQIESTHTCYQNGQYQVTIRAKDIHGNIGQPTTIQINHKTLNLQQHPLLTHILQKHPQLSNILAKIL